MAPPHPLCAAPQSMYRPPELPAPDPETVHWAAVAVSKPSSSTLVADAAEVAPTLSAVITSTATMDRRAKGPLRKMSRRLMPIMMPGQAVAAAEIGHSTAKGEKRACFRSPSGFEPLEQTAS